MPDTPETPASGDTPPAPNAQAETPGSAAPEAATPTPEATPQATPEAPAAAPASGASAERAGAYLINLSSGEVTPEDLKKPAPPPPPVAASGESRGHGGVFTVNLVSAEPEGPRPRRARKVAAAPALVTQTINLSTQKTDEQKAAERAQREEAERARASQKASGGGARGNARGTGGSSGAPPKRRDGARGGAPKPGGPRRKGGRDDARGNAPTSSGSSLAELLDPEVLKKLRGG